MQKKIWAENPTFPRKYKGKIEILSIRDLLWWKFAAVCRKIATSCPPPIFEPTTPLYIGGPRDGFIWAGLLEYVTQCRQVHEPFRRISVWSAPTTSPGICSIIQSVPSASLWPSRTCFTSTTMYWLLYVPVARRLNTALTISIYTAFEWKGTIGSIAQHNNTLFY